MEALEDRCTYLVIDDETRLVYAKAPSATVAAAVALGILNSTVITLPTAIPHLARKWAALDFAKDLYRVEFRRGEGWAFAPFPAEMAREDLLRNHALAAKRAYHQQALEVYCRSQLARVSTYLPENLSAFLHDELRACDPARGRFAQAIEEYAEISDLEPLAAYDELRFRLGSSGLVRLRTYAQQQRFMTELNGCESDDDYAAVFSRFFEETVYKALA